MDRFVLVVENQARSRLGNFSRAELREIRRYLGYIQMNPWIDGVHKIMFPKPPAVFTVHVSRNFWIYYCILTSRNIISVEDIERATDYEPIPW